MIFGEQILMSNNLKVQNERSKKKKFKKSFFQMVKRESIFSNKQTFR